MAKTKTAPRPTTELKRLLPKITHEELLSFIVAAMEEGARRADNYANLTVEDDVPRDALNEGLAFIVRLEDVIDTLSHNPRVRDAYRTVHEAGRDIKEALNA